MAENVTAVKVNNIKALREEINSLKASLSELDATGGDYKDTTEKLFEAEKQLASAMAVRKGEQNASKTSIAGMEQELKALQGTLRALSDEQKKSDWAKSMVSQAEELSEKLNVAKQNIGDYKNNIGRYAESIDLAFGKMGMSVGALTGPMKTMTSVTKDMGGALKALFANPWALILGAIVMILKKLVDAFKNNKQAMDTLKKSLEPLQPILNAFNNILAKVAEWLGVIVGWISDKLAKAFEWLLGVIPSVVNGIIDGLNFLMTPLKNYYAWVVGAVESIIKLVNKIPGTKLDGVVEALDNAKQKIKDFKIDHITADLTGLTNAVEENTEATEDNAEAAKKAYEERKKQIEDIKKRLDESEKDELQKLKEKYDKERELIKGNKEYEAKLETEYYKELLKITEQKVKDKQNARKKEYEWANRKNNVDNSDDELTLLLNRIDLARQKLTDFKLAYETALVKIATDAEGQSKEVIDTIFNSGMEEFMKLFADGAENAEQLATFIAELFKDIDDAVNAYDTKVGEKQIENIDNLNKNLKGTLDLSKKLKELSTSQGEADREADFGLTGWGTIGRNLDKEATDAQRELQDTNYRDTMDYLQSMIDAYQIELDNWKGTEEQKTMLIAEQSQLRTQLLETELQHQIDITGRGLADQKKKAEYTKSAMGGVVSILDNVESAWTDSVNAQLNAGKISQEQANKQFEAMKGIQSASALINAFLSANEAYSSLASIPYVGPALGAAASAAALAAGIANVVLINKTKVGDSSASSASTTTPQIIDSNPYEYTRQLTTAEEEDRLNRPMYVSVTDINDAQNKVKVVDTESRW